MITVLLPLALCLGPAAWSIAREGGEDIENALFIPSLPSHPGAYYWLWVSPQYLVAPPLEFDYVMEICGIMPRPIAAEQSSWGSVKNLYR